MRVNCVNVTKTIYLDTNVYVDVFEGRRPELFDRVRHQVETGTLQLVSSEVALTEIAEGNHLPSFDVGISRFFALKPKWIYLTGLTAREVIFAYDPQFATPDGTPGTLLKWRELLALITSRDDLAAFPDLIIPTANALRDFLPRDAVQSRMKYWKDQLKLRQRGFVEHRNRAGSSVALFQNLVAYILRESSAGVADFVHALHSDPTSAPAFRTDFELNDATLQDAAPKWLKNKFFDHLHAGVIPYVDLFITHDHDLIAKLEWYDENFLGSAGVFSYRPKLCSDWLTVEQRLS